MDNYVFKMAVRENFERSENDTINGKKLDP
jgi:hypothetical protein